ncbi:hypothetical protein [Eubacterium sp.]|uniref:hypothetical protein n=1 Tax=Eubacterium sp. TaxID=142586 RepID=UPI0025D1711F|nr:hypothetical protein [Eubacterium sp.]MCR5628171.1 hypothetical protein [Eubacterium sp.]
MNISEFMEKNNVAIAAKIDLNNKIVNIIKRNISIESFDLFEQLILYSDIDDLVATIEGQILPRIWVQGNSKCVICSQNSGQLVALFYDNSMNAKDNYFYAKQLDLLLKEVL